MPNKLAQAIVAGRGVLPLSYAELARMHPGLWDSPRAARHSLSGKGAVFPIRVTLSAERVPFSL
jgi:hypothetical protein